MSRRHLAPKDAMETFQKAFRSSYRRAQITQLSEAQRIMASQSIEPAGEPVIPLGHPEHQSLRVGETEKATAVVAFIDIRGCTKLAFALAQEQLLLTVQSLTTASVRAIYDQGGYIGEFTGDGVMGYFGDSETPDEDAVVAALQATTLLFKTVKEIVNPELRETGTPEIRIAAGLEYGEVLWSRIGIGETSQVKPISAATFLAGKLATHGYTKAWECKMGAWLASWVPSEFKDQTKSYEFSHGDKTFSHELYNLDWENYAMAVLQDEESLARRLKNTRLGTGSGAGAVAVGGYTERRQVTQVKGGRFA